MAAGNDANLVWVRVDARREGWPLASPAGDTAGRQSGDYPSRPLGPQWEESASMANGPIGFIGLGSMGKPMTRNLLKAGHKRIVYAIVPQAVDEIMSEGAEGARTSKEVGER